MKTTGGQKVKIGIFTLAGIGILVAGIFVIGQKKNMFGDTYHIYGKYRNVGGLQLGNNVRFAGINVGTVEKITILNDTTVKVDMRMQSKVRPFLKNDAVATIGSDGLMGDKLITIEPGDSSTVLLENNQEIETTEPDGFDKIVAKFSRVADNAEVITGALASIAGQISAGKGSLGKLIYTDSLERGLVSTINSAHATMQSAKVGVEGFSDNMTALKHNFLLKGYYKHKAKDSLKAQRKEEKEDKKAARKARRHGGSAVVDSTSH